MPEKIEHFQTVDSGSLLRLLENLGIPFRLYEHEAVHDAQAVASARLEMAGDIYKTLFLQGKNRQHWLMSAPLDSRVDLKTLAERLSSGRLSFGTGVDMERLLGVKPGSVTPLAVVNDAAGAVRLAMDAEILARPMVNVHPLINTRSIDITPQDIIDFATRAGHAPLLVEGVCMASGKEREEC